MLCNKAIWYIWLFRCVSALQLTIPPMSWNYFWQGKKCLSAFCYPPPTTYQEIVTKLIKYFKFQLNLVFFLQHLIRSLFFWHQLKGDFLDKNFHKTVCQDLSSVEKPLLNEMFFHLIAHVLCGLPYVYLVTIT